MSQVLVDSDVLINFLRQKENAKILLRKASAIGDICCSVISVTEIICGMRPEQEKITDYYSCLRIYCKICWGFKKKNGSQKTYC